MCDCEGSMNNTMEGGYYVPLLSSSIVTTFLGLAAFFYLKKKADKDLKQVGHHCSNLKECLRRGINLYHILGMTKDDIRLTPNQINAKIERRFQGKIIPKTCKPLFNVAKDILTNPNKKASYDIALEVLKFHFEFPETPNEFMELCNKLAEEERQAQQTTAVSSQTQTKPVQPTTPVPSAPTKPAATNVSTPPSQTHQKPAQTIVSSPTTPSTPAITAATNILTTASYPQQNKSPIPQEEQQLNQSHQQQPSQKITDTPENQETLEKQRGGYTNNDKIYHQKYLKYKQKYIQLLNELTY